jgi:hypothetical protein
MLSRNFYKHVALTFSLTVPQWLYGNWMAMVWTSYQYNQSACNKFNRYVYIVGNAWHVLMHRWYPLSLVETCPTDVHVLSFSYMGWVWLVCSLLLQEAKYYLVMRVLSLQSDLWPYRNSPNNESLLEHWRSPWRRFIQRKAPRNPRWMSSLVATFSDHLQTCNRGHYFVFLLALMLLLRPLIPLQIYGRYACYN